MVSREEELEHAMRAIYRLTQVPDAPETILTNIRLYIGTFVDPSGPLPEVANEDHSD